MKALLHFVVVFFLSCGGKAADEVPAFYMDESVFQPAWHLILEEAGLNPRYVDVTQSEARQLFAKGDLMVTCCTIPSWRQRPEEQSVQLFTKPFFYIVNHLVFHKDRVLSVTDPNDLRHLKVATVRGYTFEDEVKFGDIIYGDRLEDALMLVVEGKADLSIANNQEFHGQQRRNPLPIVMGPAQAEYGLRARVHHDRGDLVDRLNETIDRLRKNGKLNIAMAKGLRAAEETDEKTGQ